MTEGREIDLYFGSALSALGNEDEAYEMARQRRIDAAPDTDSADQPRAKLEELQC